VSEALRIVCAWCGRARTSSGDWRRPESTDSLPDARTTHGICHDCLKKTAREVYAR